MIHLLTAYVAQDKTRRALQGFHAGDPQHPTRAARRRRARRRGRA